MDASVGLLPLPRPLMTAEVLDAAFRLFRAGILRCLPYSGLVVLVLELPTLYSTFFAPARGVGAAIPYFTLISYGVVFLLSVPLLGVMTLRLNALAKGLRPRFRTELTAALSRWPMGLFATAFAFGYPLLLVWLRPALINSLARLRRWYSRPCPCSGRCPCSWSRCPRSGAMASLPFPQSLNHCASRSAARGACSAPSSPRSAWCRCS